jgi:hypothetical protein
MRTRIKLIALLITLFVIISVVLATPITPDDFNARIGAFTGPEGGAAQDDTAKASLDLAHTDLDAIIAAGIDTLGIQGLGGVATVWYVDSAESSGTEDGTTWATATDTIDEAISLAGVTSGDGDIILVAAGHTEALTAADGVDADKGGIKIIGLGNGENRPLLDYTNASGEFVIGADDVEIHNLQFLANVTDVTTAINIETGSENAVINNCRFYVDSTGTDEFTDAITTTANSDNYKVTNCRFEMGAGGADAAIQNVGCDYVEITDNYFSGDFATACVEDVTTASIWLFIQRNTMVNGTVGGTAGLNAVACISLKSDTAAIITDNKLFCNVASSDLAIVAADGFLSGNTYNETEASSGGSVDGLVVGQTYVATKAAVNTGTTDDLFLVTGYIQITNFFGVVTTAFAGSPGTMTIELDSADNDYDSDFSTTVNVDAAAAGDYIKFSNVIDEGVLTFTPNVSAMPAINWLCSPGMIEQTLSSTGTGNTTWYMTYIPLVPEATVTVQ